MDKNDNNNNINDINPSNTKDEILKLLDVGNINCNKEKRRRGRPKKNTQIENPKINEIENDEDSEDKEIILQLKLNENEIKSVLKNDSNSDDDSSDDESNKYEKNNRPFIDNEPINNDSDNTNSNTDTDTDNDLNRKKKEKKSKKDKKSKDKKEKKSKDKKEKKSKKDSANDDFNDYEMKNDRVTMNKQSYNKLTNTIKSLSKELLQKNEYINKITPMYSSVAETTPINIEIYDCDNVEKKVMKRKKFTCWHCTEHFDAIPIFLPETYSNGIFYVRPGFFHSVNCASGFNISLNDSNTKIRDSLLKKMFLLIFKDTIEDPTIIKITPAPNPRYRLKKFGIGKMEFDEYDQGSKMIDCDYYDNVPELVPIAGNLEAVYNNESKQIIQQNFLKKIETEK
jgi:hypothetical protein